MKIVSMKNLSSLITCGLLAISPSLLYSAPGELVDTPLSLGMGAPVDPNILMVVDDSGSMRREQLISNEAQEIYRVPPNGSSSFLATSPEYDDELLELCVAYNVMAYDPKQKYEPWVGEDELGNPYTSKTLTTALNNPYRPNRIVNIENHIYASWNDKGIVGTFERDECGVYTDIDGSDNNESINYTIYNIDSDTISRDPVGGLTDSGGNRYVYGTNDNDNFIIAPNGASQITLKFTSFRTDENDDFLRIYAGTNASGTLVATLTGNANPDDITVNSRSVYLEFKSNNQGVKGGFSLFWNHSRSNVDNPPDGRITEEECKADPNDNCRLVKDLPTAAEAAAGEVNTQENYANWFTYYRKKEYVVKKALLDVVNDSDSRMGLATLHNNSLDGKGVGTIIKDVSNAGNKATLLNRLANINSGSGTPLRRSLEDAGKYFEQGVSPREDFFGFTPRHDSDTDLTVSADSPILSQANGGQCQQNYTLLFSDGFWNGSDPNVGNTDGEVGGDEAGAYAGSAYADTYEDTLADVAMHYFERDLAPDVADTLGLELHGQQVNHQHMTTYTVAFGVNGSKDADPESYTAPFDWPNPRRSREAKIDDMRHAAFNSRGKFLNASNPQELIDRLNAVISDIDTRSATSTAAAFSTSEVSTDTQVFLTEFDTQGWWGDLKAYNFTGSSVLGEASWSADEQMKALIGDDGSNFAKRNVITYNGVKGVPFAFPADYQKLTGDDLSQVQVDDLITNAPNPVDVIDTQLYGKELLNYLLGDNLNEVGGRNDTAATSTPIRSFRGRNSHYLPLPR